MVVGRRLWVQFRPVHGSSIRGHEGGGSRGRGGELGDGLGVAVALGGVGRAVDGGGGETGTGLAGDGLKSS